MTKRLGITMTLAAVAVAGLVACTSKSATRTDSSGTMTTSAESGRAIKAPPADADTTGMSGMRGMQGSQSDGMASMMNAMMDSMQTHMQGMQGMTGNMMKSMLPAHRQMVANMLSGLNDEMRKKNMPPDARWTALMDSVRQDLVRMPKMSATELQSFMPQHGARVMRLMDMHRSMMKGMKM